jgi:hypothetical protein
MVQDTLPSPKKIEKFPLKITQQGIRALKELFREKGVSEKKIEACFPPIRRVRFKKKK